MGRRQLDTQDESPFPGVASRIRTVGREEANKIDFAAPTSMVRRLDVGFFFCLEKRRENSARL